MFAHPLLKYSAELSMEPFGVSVGYRGRSYHIISERPWDVRSLLERCDGRTSLNILAHASSFTIEEAQRILTRAEGCHVILDGDEVLRRDGFMTGRELFWRLEAALLRWREQSRPVFGAHGLERGLATGTLPPEVAKGFCLELCHLLRSVPEEIGLAVASSTVEAVRTLYVDFFEEEARHGEMITEALAQWLNEADIRKAVPLPTTTGLMHTYKAMAAKDPLLYAAALIRDEASALDADIPESEDIYAGLEGHYDVPAAVVERYRWHANLDRENEHGFFPEKIFACFPVIDAARAEAIGSALRQIIDLHEAFRWGVVTYYREQTVEERIRHPDLIREVSLRHAA
jgi:hypothetical protein